MATIDKLPTPSPANLQHLTDCTSLHDRGWDHIDQRRATVLHQAAASNTPPVRSRMLELARTLRFANGSVPGTLASFHYTYQHRVRFASAFLDLAAKFGSPTAFRIYPPGLELPADNLDSVDTQYVCDCLRRAFERAAGYRANGYVGAVARAEYNVVNDTFRFYFRGLAFGDLGRALPRINDLDDYGFAGWQGSHVPPFLRVRWRRVKSRNLSSYSRLLPYEWPRIYEVLHEREWVRQTLWTEMPQQRMAQVLLFWDSLKLRDITLLMRLRPSSTGLNLTAVGRQSLTQRQQPMDAK